MITGIGKAIVESGFTAKIGNCMVESGFITGISPWVFLALAVSGFLAEDLGNRLYLLPGFSS